jgi:hypothetical protein
VSARCSLTCLLLLASAAACKRDDDTKQGGAPADSAIPSAALSVAPPSPAALDANGCLTELDYLTPPKKYGTGDLFRSIVVDGDQIFVSNIEHVLRVPLAGGEPQVHSKAPGLLLDGNAVFWSSGERLLTQSAGESIFMASPKAGGAWEAILDLSQEKLGGGRDTATRILQQVGKGKKGPVVQAGKALFDGNAFYWPETTGKDAAATSSIRTVPLAGGEVRALHETSGTIRKLTRAGDRLVFRLSLPPSKKQLDEQAAKTKEGKIALAVRGEQHLASLPLAGGEATRLARIDNMGALVLLADGSTVYVTGYENEDLTRPGLYRIDAAPGSKLVRIDEQVLTDGEGFVYEDRVVLTGSGILKAGSLKTGLVVLTGTRNATSLSRAACLDSRYTAHAHAVAGKTLLMSVIEGKSQLASIIKIPLP